MRDIKQLVIVGIIAVLGIAVLGFFYVRETPEMFILNVGLYMNETHPCGTHGESCKAEFKTMKVDYSVFSLDGTFSLNGSIMTGENGFFVFPIPKDKEYSVRFIVDGKVGGGVLTTYPGNSDCITEIQVQRKELTEEIK